MTVVIWDGKTLAADKQATNAGLKRRVTKLRRIRGHLCAVSGDFDYAQEVFHWFESGADPANYPACQRTENWVSFLVITPDRRILKYERSPYPADFTGDGVYAMGSGRDFAIAAVYLGFDAVKGVEVASVFEAGCGLGCDYLSFD